jgi:2-polyprenyl-3-methyl-5-hydroxy-6-metoxy-1,4-benzoquinol methylase
LSPARANPESVADFWNDVYATTDYSRQPERVILDAALAYFGDVRGKTILEIGCGPGAASMYFAQHGASVIGVDVSQRAIDSLNAHCREHGITAVRGVCMPAEQIDTLVAVDFVYGSMILHHIEPLEVFVETLDRTLAPGGKGFFYENNAASDLLIWFRNHVVGHLWVPKYGDPDESPLAPSEVRLLRKRFTVDIEYPEMMFFSLAGQYLLRDHLMRPLRALDAFLYRRNWLRRYSYRQYVRLAKPAATGSR